MAEAATRRRRNRLHCSGFRRRSESRDAVVWDFDDANKIVRCKIQGSNEYILCHYPRNWQTLPSWCRRGNAVRIAHKGGIRGYMEVIGHGRAIPTPARWSLPLFPVHIRTLLIKG